MGLDSQPVAVKEESTKEHGQSSNSGIIQTAAFLNFLVSARGPYGSSLGRGGVISPGLPAERMLSSRFAVGRDRCYWGAIRSVVSVRRRARCYAEGTTRKPHKHTSFRVAALCSGMVRIPLDGLKGRCSTTELRP